MVLIKRGKNCFKQGNNQYQPFFMSRKKIVTAYIRSSTGLDSVSRLDLISEMQ